MKRTQRGQPRPEPNKVDEASAESFPASDPPSYMGSTVAGAPKDGDARRQGAGRAVRECQKSVDLNDAPKEELGSLPALSPKLVDALVAHRPFGDWQDVLRVPGFDQAIVEQLQQGGAQLKR